MFSPSATPIDHTMFEDMHNRESLFDLNELPRVEDEVIAVVDHGNLFPEQQVEVVASIFEYRELKNFFIDPMVDQLNVENQQLAATESESPHSYPFIHVNGDHGLSAHFDKESFDLNELPNGFSNETLVSNQPREVQQNTIENVELEDSFIAIAINQSIEDIENDATVNLEHYEDQHDKRRFLSNAERQLVYTALLQRSVNGKLKRFTTREIAASLSVPVQIVRRIWKRAKDTPVGMSADVVHRRTKNCGRKRIDVDIARMSDIPLNRRRTLRSLSQSLHIALGTLYSRYKEGSFRRHSNVIRPHLKEENKIARLRFCISMLVRSSIPHEPKFVDMYNVVHIDEKWFYMTRKSNSYYLLPQEEEPLRSCQSKNFISKVMFLAAIARPRFDSTGNEVFSGKIGLFPLVTKQPAIRRSRNRAAGTLETKPITSVTKDIIRAFLIEKVIHAIQSKWPREDSRNTIFIQKDNARTHVLPKDEQFQIAASKNGFDIRLMCQPPNSPDLNVLDLGFFRAIQSLQEKHCAKTVDELIVVMEKAFEEYPAIQSLYD